MIEINQELINGIIENLRYVEELKRENLDLEIPVTFLSPSVGASKFSIPVQYWSCSAWYKFFITSVNVIEKEDIKDGKRIMDMYKEYDECVLERLKENFMFELDCDEEFLNKNEDMFISFLEKNETLRRIKINLPFIKSKSDDLNALLYQLSNMFVVDYIGDSGEEYVLNYEVDKLGHINIWYYIDYPNEYRFMDLDFELLGERFIELLKKEALK